ncbi:MAG: hydantoinase/oxoprolinase family protein [Alphaproteobacteria bacterium]
MSYVVSVDVGGTFTDLILYDETTKEIHITKTPSTPEDQSIGVVEGIQKICGQAGIDPKQVSNILHGTTVATNAVLEEKGARVGLVVTEGYKQILHVARSWTPGPLAGWMIMQKPDPLAALEDTLEINERIEKNGSVLRELDEAKVEADLKTLIDSGIKALTVGLINSYINSAHEKRIREIAHKIAPDLPISLSSEVLPQFREYERVLTTVMNSYVKPQMRHYLSSLGQRLKSEGSTATLNIVRSDGGLMSAEAAADNPVNTMLSGPSGGVAGAAAIGRISGYPDIISFDMGGTSTDVSLTQGGQPQISRETRVGIYPVRAPSVEVVTIGAGGGSLAHVPITGALRVGPQSAGAVPGPASYGRGGTEPAVTDANLVLGYLPPQLVGGEMTIDVEAAKKAIQEHVADKLGTDVFQAARGIIDIVNENMLGAIRVASVERGHNPRDYALVALGGAGGLHANALSVLSGAWPSIIPASAGVLSALGFLASNIRNEFSKTYITTVSKSDPAALARDLEELGQTGLDWLAGEGVPEDKRQISYQVDMRYLRQGFELPISTTMAEVRDTLDSALVQKFHDEHMRLYRFTVDTEVEVVNLRAIAVGALDRIAFQKGTKGGPDASAAVVDAEHEAYFDGKFVTTPVYDRAKLAPGNRIEGPAVVIQLDSTSLVQPGFHATVDEYFNLVIQPNS